MKRLLDEPLSADAARLLRSAATDGPPSQAAAQARALAALDALPSAATGSPASREHHAVRSRIRAGAWAVLATAVLFTGIVATRSSSAPTADVSSYLAVAETAATSASVPPSASVEAVRVQDLPAAPPVGEDETAGKTVRRPPSGSEHPSRPGIEDELAMIDAARAALASGQPETARARVQSYKRRFRDGRFTEEAEALEIQALAAMGRHAEARTKGERFLASRPSSPYDRRVRSAIELDEVRP